MSAEMVCSGCKEEVSKLFDVEGIGYCDVCSDEAEVDIIEADEMAWMSEDY